MTMASGLYGVTLRDILDASQTAVNTGSDTFKIALVTDTHTPDFNTHDTYADVTNEIANGNGYTTGGATLASITLTASGGFLTFDAADSAWTTSTFSSVRGGIVYDDTTDDVLLCAITFGSDYSVTAGTFTVQYSANGLWRIDYTP